MSDPTTREAAIRAVYDSPCDWPSGSADDATVGEILDALAAAGYSLAGPGDVVVPARAFPDDPTDHPAPCQDCGSTRWLDWLLLPHAAFNSVCPGGDGYLCLSCFCQRAREAAPSPEPGGGR
jgi:hypothetical protein